ncbi:hypothetical protein MAP00_006619 [Monascus purpureus]|nr:hypothetical protein MAP00_006619 [Monascus purpureus]
MGLVAGLISGIRNLGFGLLEAIFLRIYYPKFMSEVLAPLTNRLVPAVTPLLSKLLALPNLKLYPVKKTNETGKRPQHLKMISTRAAPLIPSHCRTEVEN